MGSKQANRPKLYYHYALALAGILLGAWNVIAKNMLNSGTSPITFSFLRHVGSSLLYRTWHYFAVKSPSKDISEYKNYFRMIAFFTVGYQMCFIIAMNHADASIVGFFQCIGPALTLSMGLAMGIEVVTSLKIWSIALGTIGTLFVSVLKVKPSGERPEFLGCFLLFMEALCISTVVLKQKAVLKIFDSLTVLTYTYDYVALYWLLIYMITEPAFSILAINSECITGLLFSVLIINGIVYYLRILGNSQLDGSVMMLYQGVQPMATCLLGFIFLSEIPTFFDIVGGGLILSSLILASHASEGSAVSVKSSVKSSPPIKSVKSSMSIQNDIETNISENQELLKS